MTSSVFASCMVLVYMTPFVVVYCLVLVYWCVVYNALYGCIMFGMFGLVSLCVVCDVLCVCILF